MERLELLLSVAQDLTSILDLDRLLGRVGQLLQGFVPYEQFSVFIHDEERGEIIWELGIGYSEEPRRRLARFPITQGLVGRAIRTRAPVLVDDVSQDADFLLACTASGEVPRSALAIPLVHRERVVGAMVLESVHPAEFTQEQERTLSALGSFLAVAVVNARLYEASQRDAATKQLLYEASRETSSIFDLDRLLEKIADLAHRILSYELWAIYLVDPPSGDLVLRSLRGRTMDSILLFPRIERGSGPLFHAIEERRSLVTEDPPSANASARIQIPLIVKEKPVGLMIIQASEPCGFDAESRCALDTLANQTAIAIENAQLYEALLAREQKLRADLQIAKELQLSMLPDPSPRIDGFAIESAYLPADNLAGDFYDFIRLGPSRTGIVIADVSGKGVAAAMTMAAVHGAIRSVADEQDTPATVLHAANWRLFRDIERNVYVTLCYGVLDAVRRTFTYSSAGHNPPLLVRANGELDYLRAGGMVMGMFDEVIFDEQTVILGSGDLICFYTDGIVEAFDPDEESFGEKRLEAVLQAARGRPAAEIARLILESVRDFTRGREQHDDMTLILLQSI